MLLKFKADRPLIAVVALSAIEVLAPSFTQYSSKVLSRIVPVSLTRLIWIVVAAVGMAIESLSSRVRVDKGTRSRLDSEISKSENQTL